VVGERLGSGRKYVPCVVVFHHAVTLVAPPTPDVITSVTGANVAGSYSLAVNAADGQAIAETARARHAANTTARARMGTAANAVGAGRVVDMKTAHRLVPVAAVWEQRYDVRNRTGAALDRAVARRCGVARWLVSCSWTSNLPARLNEMRDTRCKAERACSCFWSSGHNFAPATTALLLSHCCCCSRDLQGYTTASLMNGATRGRAARRGAPARLARRQARLTRPAFSPALTLALAVLGPIVRRGGDGFVHTTDIVPIMAAASILTPFPTNTTMPLCIQAARRRCARRSYSIWR
jgi:hypothetical protein